MEPLENHPRIWAGVCLTSAVLILIALVAHTLATNLTGDYTQKIIIDCGIAVIAAVSLTVVNGFTGQFSIGHAAFIAIGSYVAGSMTYYMLLATTGTALSEPSLLGYRQFLLAGSCLVAGVVAAAVGFFVGLPSLRLKGDYLAIVTLGFGEIVRVMLQQTSPQIFSDQWDAATVPLLNPPLGGSLGFVSLPKLTNVFWLTLFVLGTLVLAYRLKYSTHGRAMIAIREDEIAAQAMGVNVTRLKVMAFMFAAFFGGVAGALYAHSGATLRPVDAGFQRSFDVVMMVVLGGLGSISGAAIAAVIIIVSGEWLREPTQVWHVGLALMLLRGVVAVFFNSWRGRVLPDLLWIATGVVVIEAIRFGAIRADVRLGEYRMVLFALVLILLMIFRPGGLLGLNELSDWFRRSPAAEGDRSVEEGRGKGADRR